MSDLLISALTALAISLPMTIMGTVIVVWLKGMKSREVERDRKIEVIANDVAEIKLSRATEGGEKSAESKLIWREINTDKHKIVKLQSSMDRVWEVLQKIANVKNRTSDKLNEGK